MSRHFKAARPDEPDRLRQLVTEQIEHLRWELDQLKKELARVDASVPGARQPDLSCEMQKTVDDILAFRRERRKVFGAELFGEPAWDLLLSLYQAELQQCRVSKTKICNFSGVPGTTTLRWLCALQEKGWVEVTNDHLDGRRSWVALTKRASAAMRLLLERWGR
ncbi:hypothetical protein [Sphingomonas arenae]|uniref:hypothetical protein n=1 Tax=Sphingomonas arenae TaxID=2812555 RepID=UPI001968356B|nr:hypothetical protein [Sphingomonas arenae]